MFLYSAMSFVLLVFVILCVPETKGRTLEEISKELAKKWAIAYTRPRCYHIYLEKLVCDVVLFIWFCFIRKHCPGGLCRQHQPQESLISDITTREMPVDIWVLYLAVQPSQEQASRSSAVQNLVYNSYISLTSLRACSQFLLWCLGHMHVVNSSYRGEGRKHKWWTAEDQIMENWFTQMRVAQLRVHACFLKIHRWGEISLQHMHAACLANQIRVPCCIRWNIKW